MDPFSPRDGARLDYWFWKFHVGDLAFLVDLIVRRAAGTAEVRVSQWLRGTGRVVHCETRDWSATEAAIRIGEATLGRGRSVGSAEDIAWDLEWTAGHVLSGLRGLVARVQPFDTTIVVWPDPLFSGSVTVGSERFELREVPGALYHYWGRRLPDRWVWLSATQFEDHPDRRVEGVFGVRTRLFGRAPMPAPVSILWTTDVDRREELVANVNAIIRVEPLASTVTIDARGIGKRHRLTASWGDVRPNDIGEGIIQTMHGDLTVDDVHAVPGTVGLEVRGYPSPLTPG